jgi:hypothetical protein
MEYSFPRYLLAKQSVDDRALNKDVLAALKAELSVFDIRASVEHPLMTIIEVGAGIGTMLTRLLRWDILPPNVDYTLVDEMPENITFARQWLPAWARDNGYEVEVLPNESIRLSVSRQQSVTKSVSVHLAQADVFDYIRSRSSSVYPLPSAADPSAHPLLSVDNPSVHPLPSVDNRADLLIAHAFLDLLPMPESLPKLFPLLKPRGLAWLTINFDGLTTLEPPFQFSADTPSVHPLPSADNRVDLLIERLYHQTMDSRPTGGDSKSGRHLFGHLKQASAEILAAGASDWVVYPFKGQYPADEAYFLHFILRFFETSLANHPELDPELFRRWLELRRAQIERAELVYIAHQMDFLVSPTQFSD